MTKPRSAPDKGDVLTEFLDGRDCSPRHLELAREVQATLPQGAGLHPEALMFLTQGIGASAA